MSYLEMATRICTGICFQGQRGIWKIMEIMEKVRSGGIPWKKCMMIEIVLQRKNWKN